jgi:hypothetical protein
MDNQNEKDVAKLNNRFMLSFHLGGNNSSFYVKVRKQRNSRGTKTNKQHYYSKYCKHKKVNLAKRAVSTHIFALKRCKKYAIK